MESAERFRRFTRYSLSIGIAAGVAFSSSIARADTWDKKTIVSFSQAVEVPGYVLQPGKYVMKLVDSQSNRHVVQFMNERQNRVYATSMALPAYRRQVTDRTVITFHEAMASHPEPMQYWYYPGDNFGQEFVYPKAHLREIAFTRNTTNNLPEAQGKVESNPVAIAQPAPEPVATAPEVSDRSAQETEVMTGKDQTSVPFEIAQATPPRSDESAAVAPQPQSLPKPAELPRTSGNSAGIAMLGFISLAGAFSARKLRRF